MTRRLDIAATLTTTGTVTPPIAPVPPDTAAALWSAIDAYGCDAASHGALGKDATTRAALDSAITAHVEAEVARRLAAATGRPVGEDVVGQIAAVLDSVKT